MRSAEPGGVPMYSVVETKLAECGAIGAPDESVKNWVAPGTSLNAVNLRVQSEQDVMPSCTIVLLRPHIYLFRDWH